MKHLGDITKISGYTVPIVDCVIGGSPCQDLSVAGKRAGLDGERSGLFMEQIRIVKEMREQDAKDGRSDDDVRPRYMVWENVPGALSSGKPKGEDFRIVLEEIARVKDKNAAIPRPDKWSTSGCIMGDGWSIAWRILDAQFWGTSDKPLPQRRRRIALVADFGGQSAPEILFVRKSVSGNTQPGEPKRKAASVDSAKGVGADDREGVGIDPYNGAVTGDQASTLGVNCGLATGRQAVITLDRAAFNQGKNAQFAFEISDSGIASPLVAKGPSAVCYGEPLCIEMTSTKNTIIDNGICPTLTARMGTGGNQVNAVLQKDGISTRYIVRRLTPLECERLQGFPDGWTDIGEWTDSNGKKRKTSDAARYKALGNSIALPPWKWVLKRLCACYERDATMCSLFDGIGGFPYLWEQLNGKGSCLWASEIEEFPIAVTKKRFGD